jgi:hypothetical protein
MFSAGSQFLFRYFIWFSSLTFLYAVIAAIAFKLSLPSISLQLTTLLVIVAISCSDLYRNEAGNRRVYALIQLQLSTPAVNRLEVIQSMKKKSIDQPVLSIDGLAEV